MSSNLINSSHKVFENPNKNLSVKSKDNINNPKQGLGDRYGLYNTAERIGVENSSS
jgi:hypothetical protein